VKTKPLNSEQIKTLQQIVDSFDLAWKQSFGFDPDAECDTMKLLHDFSPWEIELAYESALGFRNKNMSHTEMKAFFVRTARKWIRTYRKNHCDDWGLDITSLRNVYNLREPDPAFDSIQYAWCNLFNQPVALRFWTDQRQYEHFYHPEIRRLEDEWLADLKREAGRQAAEQKRKADQEQALAAEKSQKEWAESQMRAETEQRAKKIEEMNKEFSSDEWAFDGVDSWTARYGVVVRLCGDFDQAEVIGPKGTREHRSTKDVDELHGYACAVD
jgi:hypothetical protein